MNTPARPTPQVALDYNSDLTSIFAKWLQILANDKIRANYAKGFVAKIKNQ